jgi:hypothetical protein
MGKIRVVELKEKERQGLEEGLRSGKSHAFRKNCQLVLLIDIPTKVRHHSATMYPNNSGAKYPI